MPECEVKTDTEVQMHMKQNADANRDFGLVYSGRLRLGTDCGVPRSKRPAVTGDASGFLNLVAFQSDRTGVPHGANNATLSSTGSNECLRVTVTQTACRIPIHKP